MPVNKVKTNLLAKLGNKLEQAVQAHRGDEHVPAQMGVPAGIEGGVAQLIKCGFYPIKPGENKQNVGQTYFRAEAVIVRPKHHEGVPVAGLRTVVMENLFDTPKSQGRKTLKQHVAWIMNLMRGLGIDTSGFTAASLEPAAERLEADKPYLRFRTWKGQKQKTGPYKDHDPKVNHQWGEALENFDEDDDLATAGTDDDTGAEASTNGQVGSDTSGGDTMTIEDLLSLANSDDGDAQDELQRRAVEAGCKVEAVKKAKTWDDVAKMLNEALAAKEPTTDEESGGDKESDEEETGLNQADEETDTEETAEGEEAEESEPEPPKEDPTIVKVGQVRKYRPRDPVDPKKTLKEINVEVLEIDPVKKTAKVKNLVDGKTAYKNVLWTKLPPLS